MAVTRTHFRFRIDVWTANSESIVGHVAGIEDYELVLGTSRLACERWPRVPITPAARRQGRRAPYFGALRIRSPLGARRRPDVVWTRSARIPVWGRRPQNAPAAATRIVRASTGVMAPPAVGASSAGVVSRPASPDGKPVQNSTAMISSGNGRIFCGACGGAVTYRRGLAN